MTEKRLYLIRHGHTVWNGPPLRFQGQMDSSLSDDGRSEAIALGKRMPYQPDRIVSSPALRCRVMFIRLWTAVFSKDLEVKSENN